MVGVNKEKEKGFTLISEGCIQALNKRINEEEKASRLYHAMAVWFNANGYKGFAAFWKKWSQEELIHASWACSFLLDVNIKPELEEIPKVKTDYENIEDVLNVTFKAEMDITEQCNELAIMADEKKNYMLLDLAIKYIKEQQEEINKIGNLLAKVKAFGTSQVAMMELDEQLYELVNED